MPLPFPNIPLATDALSASQPQIQANFQALNPLVGGILAQQGAAPATAATELALYNRVINGVNQLCFRRQGNGQETVCTNFADGFLAPADTRGYTSLPSGIMLKWGSHICTAGAFNDVAFDPTVPYLNVYARFLTPDGTAGSGDVYSGNPLAPLTANTGIRINKANAYVGRIYYLVIGVPF